MKSFDEIPDYEFIKPKDAYNAGITEGIAEGRRLEREEMIAILDKAEMKDAVKHLTNQTAWDNVKE